jgi:hypothetical protein
MMGSTFSKFKSAFIKKWNSNSKFENQAILEFSNCQKPENKSSKNDQISVLGFLSVAKM